MKLEDGELAAFCTGLNELRAHGVNDAEALNLMRRRVDKGRLTSYQVRDEAGDAAKLLTMQISERVALEYSQNLEAVTKVIVKQDSRLAAATG